VRISHNADAEELRSVVREFLARPEHDWRRFALELGAAALDVPESLGGAGASFREVAVVAGELGRSLTPSPWFGTAVLAAGALLACEGPVRDELLARLATSATTATFAYRDGTTAVEDGQLYGAQSLVVDGASAELLLVTAGGRLFAVEGDAPGLVRTPVTAMDPNRELASVAFDGVPATLVGDATGMAGRVRTRAIAALACEQTGGAAAAMEMACEYARDRVQFGRPIATFQAVKHRCADMAVHVEAARSASLWAAAAVAEDSADAAQAAAAAALTCGAAYTWVAAENVQVHGGIGFTWEHSAHLHVRRAATSAVLFGQRRDHQEELLASVGV